MLLITQTNCCITTRDDNKVEPIPRVSQVGVLVDGETFGDDFNEHFDGVDCQKEEFGFFEWLAFCQKNAIK